MNLAVMGVHGPLYTVLRGMLRELTPAGVYKSFDSKTRGSSGKLNQLGTTRNDHTH